MSEVTARAEDVLAGKTYIGADSNDEVKSGSMVNNGAVASTLNNGGSYNIPKGFHNGSGKVNVHTLAEQTVANATTDKIYNGQTAWVNGSKITGVAKVSNFASFALNSRATYSLAFQWTNPSSGLFHGVRLVIKANSTPSSPTDGTYVNTTGSTSAAGAVSTYTFSGLSHNTTYYCRIYSYALINGTYYFSDGTSVASGTTYCSRCSCNCDNDGRNEYSCMDAFLGRGKNEISKAMRFSFKGAFRKTRLRRRP